jgi:hypothetical protein
MAHPNDYGLREEIAFQRRVYSFEPWVNRFPKNITDCVGDSGTGMAADFRRFDLLILDVHFLSFVFGSLLIGVNLVISTTRRERT